MKKFIVLTGSISWIGTKSFKKDDIVTEKDYPNYEELVRRGFLAPHKEEEEIKIEEPTPKPQPKKTTKRQTK